MLLLNFLRQISPTYRRAEVTVAICPTNLSGRAVLVIFCQTAPVSPGGDEGVRTPGLRLAKAALSQLSYIPRSLRWAFQDSNLRPRPYQRRALTS